MDTSASYLTGTGYEEIYQLSVRLMQKYPELFKNPFSGYVRPTNKQRTITSAMAFVHCVTDEAQMSELLVDEPRESDDVLRVSSV